MAEQRAQRQLSAILAADVAGYSRLIELDEEGTLARLKELRQNFIDPKISEHRGRIVKTMGDGLLMQFGSAVDAVRCAVDIQRLSHYSGLDSALDQAYSLANRAIALDDNGRPDYLFAHGLVAARAVHVCE